MKVNGKSVKGLNVNEAVALIRGKKGTNVKLVLHRAGVGDLNLSIKRDTIPVETVYSEMKKETSAKSKSHPSPNRRQKS